MGPIREIVDHREAIATLRAAYDAARRNPQRSSPSLIWLGRILSLLEGGSSR